jgi:Nuclease-related domain
VRVIRPSALDPTGRRRALLLACSMLAVGVIAAQLTLLSTPTPAASGVMAGAAAIGLGVGSAWLLRVLRPNRTRELSGALIEVLAPAFDDSYTLLVAPRLPIRDAPRLDGVLVGPGGVRVITARNWEGRYRVHGRTWEFDARGRRGWIRCRTNPSTDAAGLSEGFARWLSGQGFGDLPIRPAIAFPLTRSRIVLEEPTDEVITADNAPWWANSIGRVRRLDPTQAGRLVEAVLDGAERTAGPGPDAVAPRAST